MGLTRWLLIHGGDGTYPLASLTWERGGTYPLAINTWRGWDLPASFFNMVRVGLTRWLLIHGGDGTYPLAINSLRE
jgi:hypothetical protein